MGLQSPVEEGHCPKLDSPWIGPLPNSGEAGGGGLPVTASGQRAESGAAQRQTGPIPRGGFPCRHQGPRDLLCSRPRATRPPSHSPPWRGRRESRSLGPTRHRPTASQGSRKPRVLGLRFPGFQSSPQCGHAGAGGRRGTSKTLWGLVGRRSN